jgi:hypothetical protein
MPFLAAQAGPKADIDYGLNNDAIRGGGEINTPLISNALQAGAF